LDARGLRNRNPRAGGSDAADPGPRIRTRVHNPSLSPNFHWAHSALGRSCESV
jgi:hypothetical protein